MSPGNLPPSPLRPLPPTSVTWPAPPKCRGAPAFTRVQGQQQPHLSSVKLAPGHIPWGLGRHTWASRLSPRHYSSPVPGRPLFRPQVVLKLELHWNPPQGLFTPEGQRPPPPGFPSGVQGSRECAFVAGSQVLKVGCTLRITVRVQPIVKPKPKRRKGRNFRQCRAHQLRFPSAAPTPSQPPSLDPVSSVLFPEASLLVHFWDQAAKSSAASGRRLLASVPGCLLKPPRCNLRGSGAIIHLQISTL